ncbi:hypothetical protein [Burkholderia ubonensis]|uniref:hypothetical protein n=1 Tax=Burkholderia ubonensis TaxID=101571 RepID=UPI002FC61CD0
MTLATFGLAIWLAGCGPAAKQYRQDSHMTQPDLTLWQAIDTLAQQIPFSTAKIAHVLETQFRESDIGGNDVFQFFKSAPIPLSDGVVIETVDLRIKRHGAHPGFMVLWLSGSCVGLDKVREHYGNVKITDTPRGHSLDEVTSHTTALQWGELSFSFKERNPKCLSSVAFAPKK